MISALPNADPDNCDLNAPSVSGVFPIAPPASGQTVANMKVGWKYLTRDPSVSTMGTQADPVVARVAYWVDDESCKVNINTADGSLRTNATPSQAAIRSQDSNQVYSYGFGTPSEISLAGLPAFSSLPTASITAIAAYPWTQEFNSAEEITRVKDSSGNQIVTSNTFNQQLRFDITHYNSSPDLNFMGEPQISLMARPITETAETAATSRQNLMIGAYEKGRPSKPRPVPPVRGRNTTAARWISSIPNQVSCRCLAILPRLAIPHRPWQIVFAHLLGRRAKAHDDGKRLLCRHGHQ